MKIYKTIFTESEDNKYFASLDALARYMKNEMCEAFRDEINDFCNEFGDLDFAKTVWCEISGNKAVFFYKTIEDELREYCAAIIKEIDVID